MIHFHFLPSHGKVANNNKFGDRQHVLGVTLQLAVALQHHHLQFSFSVVQEPTMSLALGRGEH